MKHGFTLPALLSSLGLLSAVTGCSAGNDPSSFGDESGAGGIGASGSGSGASMGAGGDFSGATTGAGGSEIAEVFSESAENLYRLDPKTKQVTLVGPFSGGCFPVIDIAVDKDSNIYATTYEGLYRVDRTTAVCTLIAMGAYPNSLSFVPIGTVDPSVEALVGYNGATYIRIDITTGTITNIGGLTGGFSSSGDIVSVKNGKTLLTVKGDGCGVNDCLLEVDPKTGDLVKNWGQLPYTDVFGLAFWAGTAYGFDQNAELFQVTFMNNAIQTFAIPIPSPPPNMYFWGAGSTTSAPPDVIPD